MRLLSKSILCVVCLAGIFACKNEASDFSLSPQPIIGETYTYHLESVSTRSYADEEEVMTQNYTFSFVFGPAVEGLYPAKATFESYDIERPEDVRFTEIMADVQQKLLNDTAQYTLSPTGAFTYQTTVDYSIFEQTDQMDDPEKYIEVMTLYMEENIRSNHFLEWVAYAPDTTVHRKSSWYTTSDLNLMGLVDINRTFNWEVKLASSSSMEIQGVSEVGNFGFKLGDDELSGMNMVFEGTIISTYDYTISRPDNMILKAEIVLETDGVVKNKVDDALDGSIINEPLIGKSKTTVRRVR